MLSEEISPSPELDRATQLKMRDVGEQNQSALVTSLSIISLVMLLVVMLLFLPQIQTISLKIILTMLNANVFMLFIFFLIINNKNRKEVLL